MALATGLRFGAYDILGPLGVGGMGEVYRARDTRLNREVALKVLPEAFSLDPDRLARFAREAQVLASLNHPNIAAIYGIEESNGVRALVLELVEGPTLADRIAERAMPLDEALPIAKQIVDALEAAHEQGIIHRDLKPANIKVRPDGTVKVLDFGLAKALEPAAGASQAPSLTASPTITTPAMTMAGVILGTAAYMSPEQAKGRPADKRSDIWAFGCVLYEMLTGRRAFDGEDTGDTLASVLKSEPDWAALPPDMPPAIATVLHRCLAKDRRQRIADMSVAIFVLSDPAVLTPALVLRPTVEGTRAGWRPVLIIAAAVVGASTLTGLGAWFLREPSALPIEVRFSIRLPEGQRFTNAGRNVVAISPDGTQLAYVASTRLYVGAVAAFDSHEIPGTEVVREGIVDPVFSPDGRSLAFVSLADRTVKRVGVSGGAPVTMCALDELPLGMTWDGSGMVVGLGIGGIGRCANNGGKPEPLATVEMGELAFGPQILPGGESLIFTIAKRSDGLDRWNRARIVAHSLASGDRQTLIAGGSDGRYVSTGHLLYALGGSIFAVRFDPGRLVVTGPAVSVVQGVRRATGAITGVAHFDVSRSDLVYVPGPSSQSASESTISLADRAGVLTPLKIPPGQHVHVRASGDGARLAIDIDDGKEANIFIHELTQSSQMRRLTFGGRNQFPIWSADGQRVAFQSDRDGDLAMFVQGVDGSGLKRLTKPEKDEAHVPESWSPDGRHVSFSVKKDDTFSLWILSLIDGKISRFGNVQSIEPLGSVFSPNSRWIAYHALRAAGEALSTRSGVFVEPFPATGVQHQAPKVTRDFHPLWSRDARELELFYIATTASARLETVQHRDGVRSYVSRLGQHSVRANGRPIVRPHPTLRRVARR